MQNEPKTTSMTDWRKMAEICVRKAETATEPRRLELFMQAADYLERAERDERGGPR